MDDSSYPQDRRLQIQVLLEKETKNGDVRSPGILPEGHQDPQRRVLRGLRDPICGSDGRSFPASGKVRVLPEERIPGLPSVPHLDSTPSLHGHQDVGSSEFVREDPLLRQRRDPSR